MEDDAKPTATPTPGDGAPLGPSPRPSEPSALPLTYCRRCQVEVVPVDKGKCPRCGGFLRLNFASRKHPVNILRRDALFAELVADYAPTTTILRHTCMQLAGTLEQLEEMRPGSPEWQRLVNVAQTLGSALRDTGPGTSEPREDYSGLSDDALIKRTEGLLQQLRDVRDAKRVIPLETSSDATEYMPTDPRPATPNATAETPPALCPYGCGSLTECEELRTKRPDDWSVAHFHDPAEAERRRVDAARREAATAAAWKRAGIQRPSYE